MKSSIIFLNSASDTQSLEQISQYFSILKQSSHTLGSVWLEKIWDHRRKMLPEFKTKEKQEEEGEEE